MIEQNRIIIALDYDNPVTAWEMVERLGDNADNYKVGRQLLTAAGSAIVGKLIDARKRVYLDLEFYGIPISAAGAVASAGALGCSMVTVQASVGSKALSAAVRAAEAFPDLMVLALAAISSTSDSDLEQVKAPGFVEEKVLRLATLSIGAGCKGLVVSPIETQVLRRLAPDDTVIVTSGIQLDLDVSTDEKKMASPRHAIDSGASFLIIGSSITQARDPLEAFNTATVEAV